MPTPSELLANYRTQIERAITRRYITAVTVPS